MGMVGFWWDFTAEHGVIGLSCLTCGCVKVVAGCSSHLLLVWDVVWIIIALSVLSMVVSSMRPWPTCLIDAQRKSTGLLLMRFPASPAAALQRSTIRLDGSCRLITNGRDKQNARCA